MSTRTIRTVLELHAQRYQAGAAAAAASTKALSREISAMTDASGKLRADYDRAGNTILGFGAAAVTGLGLVTKSAMDWESAWAGVLKTVDGSPEQLAAVEEGLRGLARELPASHTEIAAVAEAAGQLGIQTDSVVEFTRTMINLGETTNLSAEEAATSLARFSNVMGTSQDDVDRLGATIVGLGNNYATTESEILAMAMRLSGIGSQLNLSEGEVLGLSAAMSSVGIEAEAGGTAMTMGMKKISSAVREGGEDLAGFAEVAGMSSEEFARLWNDDAAAGLEAFVSGLQRVGAEGGSVAATLDELGIKGIRESDTFLRLSANADGLADSMAQGNTEFERNIALVEEAQKRYDTTASQLQIARNALVDAGIDLGAQVLPALAGVAGAAADTAEAFAALPDPVKESIVVFGAVAGGTALLAGGLMKVIPVAQDTIGAFRRLKAESPQAASALGRVGRAATVAGVAFVGLQALGAYVDTTREAAASSDDMASAFLNAAATGEITTATVDKLVAATGTGNAEVRDLAHALEILDAGSLAKAGDFFASGLGVWDTQTEVAVQQVGELDRALASLYASGNAEAVADVLNQSGVAVEDLLELSPLLSRELTDVATSMELEATAANLAKIATGEIVPPTEDATAAAGEFSDGLDGATDSVEEQVDALAELQDLLQGTSDLLLGARGSARDFEASLDAATEAIEKNGKTLDRGTEAGRANEAALDDVAASTHDYANAQEELGATAEELDGIMQRGRDSFIETATAMGMPKDEAEALADELQLIPAFVETEFKVDSTAALADWEKIFATMWPDGGHPPMVVPTEANTEGAIADVQGVDPPEVEVPVGADTTEAEGNVKAFEQIVSGSTYTAVVDADTLYGEQELYEFQVAINDAGGTVTINGETLDAEGAMNALLDEINAGEGVVMINGNPVDGETALLQLISYINGGHGEVTIDGDNVPAIFKTDQARRHADGTTGTISVDAATGQANRDIDYAARNRTAVIKVTATGDGIRYTGAAGSGVSTRAGGGWIEKGLNGGGWVPGPNFGPGIDNIMWPLAGKAGGGYLDQPLAGGEYVVREQQAKPWGPVLEAINAGAMPAPAPSAARQLSYTSNNYGPDPQTVSALSFGKFQQWAQVESTGHHP